MERKKYVVSQEYKSGLWYAHLENYPYIPVFGSFSEKRSESTEYAKMMNGKLNRVEQIERKRQRAWQESLTNKSRI